jgi:biopolymer transport protein ExbB
MPNPDRRTPARLLALTLAFGLLGAACGLSHAQAAAERSSASAASSAPVAIAAPALTPSRDLPLIRPPSTESPAAPYGLQAVWEQGDPVARATLLILLIMSMASWYVLVRKLIEQARMRRLARSATASLPMRKACAKPPTCCSRAARSVSSPNRQWPPCSNTTPWRRRLT